MSPRSLKKLKIWLRSSVLLVGVALGAIFTYAHLFRRADVNIDQARALIEQRRLIEARNLLESALETKPNSIRAMRLMAVLLRLGSSREEFEWLRRIWEEEPDLNVLTALVDSAIKWERFEEGEAVLGEATGVVKDADRLLLGASIAVEREDFSTALIRLEGAFSKGVLRSDRHILNWAILKATQPNGLLSALIALEEIPSESEFFSEAIWNRFQLNLRSGNIAGATEVGLIMLKDSKTEATRVWEALDLVSRNQRDEVSECLKFLSERFFEEPVLMANLLQWAERNRFDEWIDSWISKNRDASIAMVPPLRWSVGGHFWRSGRKEELREWLGSDGMVESSPYGLILKIALESEVGRESFEIGYRKLIGIVVDRVGVKDDALERLGQYAVDFGLDVPFETILWHIARQEAVRDSGALRMLYSLYRSRGDSRNIYRVISRMTASHSVDDATYNNLAAIGLLIGEDLPRMYRIAERVGNAHPDQPHYVSTFAYSLILQGRALEGLQLLEQFPEETLMNPAIAPYYARALSAVGNQEKAMEVVKNLDLTTLLPEEISLVNSIRNLD